MCIEIILDPVMHHLIFIEVLLCYLFIVGPNTTIKFRSRSVDKWFSEIWMDQRGSHAMFVKYLGCYAVFAVELGRRRGW